MKKFWSKYWFAVLFTLILVMAVFTRFYQLGAVPVSLYWDEASILVEAKTVSQTGLDQHSLSWYHLIYPAYGDYKLAPYIWLASLSVKIFGVSAWALRLPSALAGIITIIVAGLIARRLSNLAKFSTLKAQLWQLATMLILTISPWAILFSRTAFEGHLAQCLLTISVYFLLNLRQKYWQLIFSSLFVILAAYTYYSVRFVAPFVIAAIAIFILVDWSILKNWRQTGLQFLKQIGLYLFLPLAIFGLGLLPASQADFSHETNVIRLGTKSIMNDDNLPHEVNQYRAWAGNNLFSRLVFNQKFFIAEDLLKNLSAHLNPAYLFITGDNNLRHGTGVHGLFLFSMLPFLIIGVYQLGKHKFSYLLVLLIWWGSALLPASVPLTVPHALRSLNGLVPITLLIGSGLGFTFEFLINLKLKKKTFNYPLLIVLVLILLTEFIFFYYYYLTIYPKTSSSDWQDGVGQVAEFIVQNQNQVNTVNVLNIDDLLYLWYYLQPEISAQTIQQQETHGFRPQQISNINFAAQAADVISKDNQQLVFGQADTMLEILNQKYSASEAAQIQPVFDYQTANHINHFQGFLLPGSSSGLVSE